jgi:hypothetical protein
MQMDNLDSCFHKGFYIYKFNTTKAHQIKHTKKTEISFHAEISKIAAHQMKLKNKSWQLNAYQMLPNIWHHQVIWNLKEKIKTEKKIIIQLIFYKTILLWNRNKHNNRSWEK